jgi:hypothetical protein
VFYVDALFGIRPSGIANRGIALTGLWIPAAVNLAGVKQMAWFQNLTVVLKFLPLLFAGLVGWFFVSKGFNVSGAACATRPGSLPGWPCSRSSAWRSRHHGQAGAQPAGERRPGLAARHRRQHDLVPGHGGRGDGPGPAPRAGRRDGAVRDRVRDDFAHGVWAGKLVAALAVVSGIGALNGWTLVTPEVSRAAASDRLFPRAFAWIDRKDRPRSRSNWPPLTCRKQVVLRADAGIQLVDGDTGQERHVLQLGLAAASAPNQIGPTAHFGAHAKCSGFRDLSSFGSREKPESADARRPRPNRQRREDGC